MKVKDKDEFTFVWEERRSVRKEALRGHDCAEWYSPLEFKKFKWYMEMALKIHPGAKTFLDVGSGVGDKVKYMEMEGLEAHGIELSRILIKKYEKFRGLTIFYDNILEFDRYGDYEIIYVFNPIPENPIGKSSFGTSEVVDRIFRQYKGGTQVIVAAGYGREAPGGWIRIDCDQQTSGIPDNIFLRQEAL